MAIDWDGSYGELTKTRFLYQNEDYLAFLVERVWKISAPVRLVDFGCGYGWVGLKLLPLLPDGSTYTGVDASATLLEKARELFAGLPHECEFCQSDVHHTPLKDASYDIAFSHAVLTHVRRPDEVLREMIRTTRGGGLVITCEANRLAHMAAYHTSGPVQPAYDLGLMQRYYRGIFEQDTVDYNIGLRVPSLLHREGLLDIGCRLSDCVRCHLPGSGSPEELRRMEEAMSLEGYGNPIDEARMQEIVETYVRYGISEDDAVRYAHHLRSHIADFIENGEHYDIVYPGMMSFAWGTVPESSA